MEKNSTPVAIQQIGEAIRTQDNRATSEPLFIVQQRKRLYGGFLRRSDIGIQLKEFIGQDCTPEFWGYFADYDWVVTCWLFGSMIDLPSGWPMYCRDIKQLMDSRGISEIPIDQPDGENAHHALSDARWNKKAHAWLNGRRT